jgi:heterodisulfide reductase subunit A
LKNDKTICENPKIGVFICHCGVNIGGYIDVPKVVKYANKLPGVVYAEGNLYTCSSDGITKIREAIEEHNLNRVVVASCTPRTHEILFRETCEDAGLNKYLFQMANIREHCSWVHMREPKEATEKAIGIVRMAVAKAWYLQPQEESEVQVTPASLVIGAGISGMRAALSLAYQGFRVYLIDRDPQIGGMLKDIYRLYPTGDEASEFLASVIRAVKAQSKIEIYSSTEIEEVKGYIGNFEVIALQSGKDKIKFRVGTIIVATGAGEFKPEGMFGYGHHKNVITQLELEKLLKKGFPPEIKKVVMIQCVGAMEEQGREYCSKICCTVALKNALFIKETNPEADIHILYRHLQAYGKEYEDYYRRAQEQNVKFINYLPVRGPTVEAGSNDRLNVNVFNTFINEEVRLDSDLVVLSTPLVQQESNKDTSSALKVPVGASGFFLEAHVKLKPVDFATDGIFVCGTAHSPKAVAESIIQALAAASSAAIPMVKGHVRSEAITAVVDEELCRGCGKCKEACEYSAITLEEKILEVEPFTLAKMLLARVNEVVCKGCGSCSSTCPTGAIKMKHFTDKQILAQIKAAYGGLSH